MIIYNGTEWEEMNPDIHSHSYLTRTIITTGFVMGGYKDGTPYKNVNTMVHATDVCTNNGDVMTLQSCYTSGACNLIHGFLWSCSSAHPGTTTDNRKFHMNTMTGSTAASMVVAARNDCGTIFKETEMAWIQGGGTSSSDVFNLTNETMYSNQSINPGYAGQSQQGVSGHSGETKGFIWQDANQSKTLTFATGTSVSIATTGNAAGMACQQKGLCSKLGKGYAGNEGSYNGGNNLRVFSYTNETYTTVAKPVTNCGEENFDMGQAHQYMMGNYDGVQNNRGWRFTYATDSGYELSGGSLRTGIPGGSSGHCAWRA